MASTIDIEKLQPEEAMVKADNLRLKFIKKLVDPQTELIFKKYTDDSNCYVCQSKDYEYFLAKEGFIFVKCKKCGLIYTKNKLKDKLIEEMYSKGGIFDFFTKNVYIPSELYRKKIFYHPRLEKIEKYHKKGKILDIGCSSGYFLQTAKERGWKVYGVEPGSDSYKHAANVLKLKNIKNCTLHEAKFNSKSFDVCYIWMVLEHISNPKEVLEETYRITKKRGLICLAVPNIDSVQFDLLITDSDFLRGDLHLSYFTPATIKKTLEAIGFKVIDIVTEGLDISHIVRINKRKFKCTHDFNYLEKHMNYFQNLVDKTGRADGIKVIAKKI